MVSELIVPTAPEGIRPPHLPTDSGRRVSLVRLLAVMLGMALVSPPCPAEEHWPNWMGPRRDGISRETGWSTDWPEAGLRVRWTKPIGVGFSSIAIDHGRLFTLGHIDGEEVVWCLDASDGRVLWDQRYPSELNDNLHEGGPAATPTVDGDAVYTLGKIGQLHCFEAKTGKPRWRRELRAELEVPTPEWGFSSSPVILGDQLILEAGRVVSYHKQTGELQWKSPRHEAGYGSAAYVTLPPSPRNPTGEYVATLDCEGLRLTTLQTGEQVAFRAWSSPFRTNATTPIVQGNRFYISTAYQVGCGLFEFDGEHLQQVYTNRNMRNHFNNSILYKGYLYGFDGNSNLGRVVRLTCMNFETGEVAWQEAGFGCGSLMIADGKLIILSEAGQLVVATATPDSYQELARSPLLTGRCWTVPVLLNGRVYARNAAGNLVCAELPPAKP